MSDQPGKNQPGKAAGRRRRPGRDARGEGGLHGLVGGEPSQVGVSAALRARDLNRPTAEELADAEREVVLVRRHWTPPAQP